MFELEWKTYKDYEISYKWYVSEPTKMRKIP